MRKTLSVLGLWVRCTLWGALGIIALAAGGELLLIWRQMPYAVEGRVRFYGKLLENIGFGRLYMAALALLVIWLMLAAKGRHNTLGRLSVPVNVSAALYGFTALMWLTVLWGVELVVVLVGYRWFSGATDPVALSGQTLMLEFYRLGILRWLLPLEDLWLWVEVTVVTVTLSASIAADVQRLWLGGAFPVSTAVTVGAALLAMAGEGAGLAFALFVCLIVLAVAVYRLRPMGRGEDGI